MLKPFLLRLYSAIFLLFGFYWLFLGQGFVAWQGAVFLSGGSDRLLWFLQSWGFFSWLLASPALALFLDASLLLLPLLLLFGALRSWAALCLALLWALQLLLRQLVALQVEHIFVPLFFLALVLSQSRNRQRFVCVWAALRLYVCFLFGSAALWKLGRVGFLAPEQFSNILIEQHIEYLYQYPESPYSSFILWLSGQLILSASLWSGAIALQLSFLLGFFSKRFDKFLAFFLLLFLCSDALLMRLHFWPYLLYAPLFFEESLERQGH